jgi:Kef-type K+ transport system membrane component KefB
MVVGLSGMQWVTPLHIESASLFIDLAMGLVLFELGYLVPRMARLELLSRLAMAGAVSGATAMLVFPLFIALGFGAADAFFASALCLATSPAITIATCSDVRASGERTDFLYMLVAANGALAFCLVALVLPFLGDAGGIRPLAAVLSGTAQVVLSLILALACAGIVLLAGRRLRGQAEHQHILILGTIVLGVGTAIFLELSIFLPMLVFGLMVKVLDRRRHVIAMRIASDARVFLVIAFVLAGAALDIAHLREYWREAFAVVLARVIGQYAGVRATAKLCGLERSEALSMTAGLQPMSSVALILLFNIQVLYADVAPGLVGVLMATILIMQLLGPLATQTAIRGFGEDGLRSGRPPRLPRRHVPSAQGEVT